LLICKLTCLKTAGAYEATIVLEDEKLKYDTCVANAKETYYKILTNKLLTEEAISSEIKSYELSKIDVRALLARYKERMLLIPDLLNNKKRVLENIKKVQQTVEKQKELTFAGHKDEFNALMDRLKTAQIKIHEYVDLLSKLTAAYSEVSGTATSLLHIVEFIIAELRSITFWYRPDYAISWNDVKNIPTDIIAFFFYVRSYASRMTIAVLAERMSVLLKNPEALIALAFKLMCVALFFLPCSARR